MELKAEIKVKEVSQLAEKVLIQIWNRNPEDENTEGSVRIYVDGGFDLPHSGHYNAIRQARNMGDYLVVGVNRDEDLTALKGPPVLNVRERAEILRHCKFIDEVIEGTEYTPTLETLAKNRCGFYAHGDDPCIDINGVDVTAIFTKNNMYK